MADLPPPVGSTASTSRPAASASAARRCPGRSRPKPSRSRASSSIDALVTATTVRPARSPAGVDDEVAGQAEQDMVGGQQPESRPGGLRYQQAIERVMPHQLGKVPDRLGMLGGDAQQ